MIEILSIGVAAWMVYEAVRAVTPVPAWLQPLVVIGICSGLLSVPPVVLTVLHAAAVVAIIRMLLPYIERPRLIFPGDIGRRSFNAMRRKGAASKPGRIPDLP